MKKFVRALKGQNKQIKPQQQTQKPHRHKPLIQKTKAKVSVIIPVFNKQHYIQRCLSSVIIQSHRNIEILVWDDGSVDDSVGIIKTFKDKRIKLFEGGTNHGVSFARNRLMEASSGDVIAFQDADDISHPHRIAIQLAVMNKYGAPRCRTSVKRRAAHVLWSKWSVASKKNNQKNWNTFLTGKGSGCFATEMFLAKPLVLFDETVLLREDLVWLKDMLYVWDSKSVVTNDVLYSTRGRRDSRSLGAQVHNKRRNHDVVHARLVFRKRWGSMPERLLEQKREAESMKAALVPGAVFGGDH